MFEKKGMIMIDCAQVEEEQLMDVTLEAGAEDIKAEDNEYEVTMPPEKFDEVKSALEKENIDCHHVSRDAQQASGVALISVDQQGENQRQQIAGFTGQ